MKTISLIVMAVAMTLIFSTSFAQKATESSLCSLENLKISKKEKAKIIAKQRQDSCIKALNRLNKDSIILSILKINATQGKEISSLKNDLNETKGSFNSNIEAAKLALSSQIENASNGNKALIEKTEAEISLEIKALTDSTTKSFKKQALQIDKKASSSNTLLASVIVFILIGGVFLYAQYSKKTSLAKIAELKKYTDAELNKVRVAEG